jgi:uncharacterized membrane protein YbhN (UPF0104 family)
MSDSIESAEEVEASPAPTVPVVRRKGLWWRRWLPWVATVGIGVYLVVAHDIERVKDAIAAAPMMKLLPFWVVSVGVVYLADVGCLHSLFRRTGQRASFAELRVVKGASYLLNIINYNAAVGGIAVVLARRKGRPILEYISTMLMLSTIDLVGLSIYTLTGIAFLDTWPDVVDVEVVAMIAGTLVVGYLGGLVYWCGGWDFLILGRMRSWTVFHAFRVTRLADHAILVAQRAGFMGLYFLIHYFSLDLFGIPIPWTELLVYNAVITIVGGLPISIAGLGTTQVVTIALYSAHGSEEAILAYSALITFSFVVLRAVIGYAYLPRLTELTEESATAPAQPIE